MEPRGMMGGLYRISEWIMRLSAINLLWLLCASPFFFFLLTFLLGGDVPEDQLVSMVVTTSIILGVIAPFTIFPSTAAMFTVARKWVMGETDVPLFKTFFRGYKENFKQSIFGGLIYTALFVILFVDFYVYREQLSFVAYIFIAFLILLGISLFNYFSMQVHYHMKTLQLLKNAVLITIGKPFRSLSTAIMCGVVLYISFFQFTWLLPFFTGSIVAFLSFWNFNIIYMKLQEQLEKMSGSDDEAAEEIAELDREDLVKSDYKETK